MKRLKRLCEAVRALSPYGAFSLTGAPDETGKEQWKGVISIGGVILVESLGNVEDVVAELTKKLERMSQRMMAKLSAIPPSIPPSMGGAAPPSIPPPPKVPKDGD